MARRLSAETYPGQRRKEKRALWSRFALRPIERLYKRKFYELFGCACFKCGYVGTALPLFGYSPYLCVDHHVAMALGGHLVPGNLVALCRTCNGQKLDQAVEEFYSIEELDRLQPMLVAQEQLFSFKFDEERWYADPAGYLLSLGIDQETVVAVLDDEFHPDFVGRPEPFLSISLSIDL